MMQYLVNDGIGDGIAKLGTMLAHMFYYPYIVKHRSRLAGSMLKFRASYAALHAHCKNTF